MDCLALSGSRWWGNPVEVVLYFTLLKQNWFNWEIAYIYIVIIKLLTSFDGGMSIKSPGVGYSDYTILLTGTDTYL